jgi:hypothetical protein
MANSFVEFSSSPVASVKKGFKRLWGSLVYQAG